MRLNFAKAKQQPWTSQGQKNPVKKKGKLVVEESRSHELKPDGGSDTNTVTKRIRKTAKEKKADALTSMTPDVRKAVLLTDHGTDAARIASPFFDQASSSLTNDVKTPTTKLQAGDYDKPCVELARFLLGKVLVCQLNGGPRISGRIVETESYLGGEDKASHSYAGKRTERTAAMYMSPGTAYVYNIYESVHLHQHIQPWCVGLPNFLVVP